MKVRSSSAGIHLFDRKTGLNCLIDEVVVPPEKWSTAPRQVSIALTNTCDLECSHCYAPKDYSTLNFSYLTSWLNELDFYGCLGVGLGGGEPTLYPKLSELCDFVDRKTDLALTMTTHGHRLSQGLLDTIAGRIHFLRVSMDGIGDNYESIRGRPFDSFLEKVSKLKGAIPFGINYVVNDRTIGDLGEAAKICAELGVREFLLLPEKSVRRGRPIDQYTLAHLHDWINNYTGSLNLAISKEDCFGLSVCDFGEEVLLMESFAHISARGELKVDSFSNGGEIIGNSGIIKTLINLRTQRNT